MSDLDESEKAVFLKKISMIYSAMNEIARERARENAEEQRE